MTAEKKNIIKLLPECPQNVNIKYCIQYELGSYCNIKLIILCGNRIKFDCLRLEKALQYYELILEFIFFTSISKLH